MSYGPSLREQLIENYEDIDAITKQVVAFLFLKDRSSGSLLSLCSIFIRKHGQLKGLIAKVPKHLETEERIRGLEKAVEARNKVIEEYQLKLILAESALSEAVYQASVKLKSIRQADANKVNSEVVIRFAHHISKSYSVAAPLHWQIGDASRPFPTEVEFRVSSLAAPRFTAPAASSTTLSMLRQPSNSSTILRGSGGRSPMVPYSALQQRSWSPRSSFSPQLPSPRGRGTRGGLTSPRVGGGSTHFAQRHQSGASPRMSSPSSGYVMGNKSMNMTSVEPSIEQMSTDSSSSSSSDEGSPS